jgi:multiple sugar transport system substrate-binding protein
MLWSASPKTKNPEAAVAVIDWWVNSVDCANICLAERGIPANAEILAAITPKLAEAQQQVATFISDIKPELAATPIAPPPGGGTLAAVMQRYTLDMQFGRLSPNDASTKFVDEVKSNLTV